MDSEIINTESLMQERAEYKYGFVTDVETERLPKGLNEEVIRAISEKKEPDWLLDFRLKAYRNGSKWRSPTGPTSIIPPSTIRRSATTPPQKKASPQQPRRSRSRSLKTFERLGIPLDEQKRLTQCRCRYGFRLCFYRHHFSRKKLDKPASFFAPFPRLCIHYPDLVKKYLGTLCPLAITSLLR